MKRIINTSPAAYKLVRQEYSVFLDWFFYHEALAEFTVRHWKVPYEGCGFAPIARSPKTSVEGRLGVGGSDCCIVSNRLTPYQAEDNIGCPTDVLQLMVHTCRRAIVPTSIELRSSDAETEHSKMLEQNIYKFVGDYGPIRGPSATPMSRNDMLSDLHRIACLLYVNRAVHCVARTEFHHKRLVREGVLLLAEMITCQNAWPLFIIACEAIDDDQRLTILNVFEQSRRDQGRRSNHIHFIQHMVEAIWTQHDLNVENQVDYLTIFDAVIGGVPFMPLFA